MAVRRQQYAKELEKQLATGKKGLRKAHVTAIKKTVVKKARRKKSDWVKRLKKNVQAALKKSKKTAQMIVKGPKYYESIGGKHSKKKGY